MALSGKLLYLFSSNIRPLYVQDILDVLAAPAGTVYRFRYEKKYLNDPAQEVWGSDSLDGTHALVHFSLQQEARYHDPILFPVRKGEVVGSSIEGSAFIVEFSLGSIVSLPEWPTRDDENGRPRPAYEDPPGAYKRHLEAAGVGLPYRFPASLSDDVTRDAPDVIDDTSDEEILFERNTVYLSKTDAFRSAVFVRFLRLTPQGRQEEVRFDQASRAHLMDGGETYSLQVTQRQPRDVTVAQRFVVDVDEEIVSVVGAKEFEVASRYDRIPIAIHAISPPTSQTRETLIVLRPLDPEVQGPTVRVPVKVRPAVGQAVEGLATTLGLVLVAIFAPFQDESGWFTLLAVGGVLLSQVAIRMTPFVGWLKRVFAS